MSLSVVTYNAKNKHFQRLNEVQMGRTLMMIGYYFEVYELVNSFSLPLLPSLSCELGFNWVATPKSLVAATDHIRSFCHRNGAFTCISKNNYEQTVMQSYDVFLHSHKKSDIIAVGKQ